MATGFGSSSLNYVAPTPANHHDHKHSFGKRFDLRTEDFFFHGLVIDAVVNQVVQPNEASRRGKRAGVFIHEVVLVRTATIGLLVLFLGN